MRSWKGGVLQSMELCSPQTGTACRQSTLPRIEHNINGSDKSEPFGPRQAFQPLSFNQSYGGTDNRESRCVYQYNERYAFSRVIRSRDLCFDSHFEGGNLLAAFRREPSKNNISSQIQEYDLEIHHDVHSMGHRQYFYFSVSNVHAGMTVKFNIGNFTKPTSLYSRGLRPLCYSEKMGRWERVGTDISYHPKRPGTTTEKPSRARIMTFTHTFELSSDKCFFASSIPYTYSDLQDYLYKIQSKQGNRPILRRSLLCHTLGGNRCDVLTITQPTSSLSKLKQRLGVLITARVHPGETNASWMCKGLIDFLIGDSDEAEDLRKTFVFKIIPMLNPDGVINGNYRTSLSGSDLNRRWNNPHAIYHPTIFHTKQHLKKFMKTHHVVTTCDIHGHSRREGAFMYGCSPGVQSMFRREISHIHHVDTGHEQPSPYLFPRIFDEKCPFFDVSGCMFKSQTTKASTMRIVMNREFGITCSYTLEASLSGYRGHHFSTTDLQAIGKDYCLSLLRFYNIQFGQTIGTKILQAASPTKARYEQSEPSYPIIPSTDEDSGGSDSNPSEDNLSETEALNLLSNDNIERPPRRKKKVKRRRRKVKKVKKRVSSPLLESNRGPRQCPIVTIQLNHQTQNSGRITRQRPTSERKKKSITAKPDKKSLAMVTFPLDA